MTYSETLPVTSRVKFYKLYLIIFLRLKTACTNTAEIKFISKKRLLGCWKAKAAQVSRFYQEHSLKSILSGTKKKMS